MGGNLEGPIAAGDKVRALMGRGQDEQPFRLREVGASFSGGVASLHPRLLANEAFGLSTVQTECFGRSNRGSAFLAAEP